MHSVLLAAPRPPPLLLPARCLLVCALCLPVRRACLRACFAAVLTPPCSITDSWQLVNGSRFGDLPSWSASDVEAFKRHDPATGADLNKLRTAGSVGMGGSAVGAAVFGMMGLRYSKLPGLVFLAPLGAAVGFAIAEEAAGAVAGAHRVDTVATNGKFLQWWSEQPH